MVLGALETVCRDRLARRLRKLVAGSRLALNSNFSSDPSLRSLPPTSPLAEARATYLYHAAHVLRRTCISESRLLVRDMILGDETIRSLLHPSLIESVCPCGEMLEVGFSGTTVRIMKGKKRKKVRS